MKTAKPIALIGFVLAMILAFSIPVYAIGFDTEEIYNSVFVIFSGNSLGSGFAIGENCIITNAHVISNRNDVRVATYSGDIENAFVVSMNEDIDIAVLGVSEANFKPLKVADFDAVSIGDDVYAIGAPNSLAFTLTKGVVSAKERNVSGQKFVQTDAAINMGNSGGPLLNDTGKVIGVNSYKISDSEGIGLAIPIDVVLSYLDTGEIELNENGNVAKPVTEETISELDSPGYAKDDSHRESTATIIVLAVCLVISIALNIILIIILVFQKRKNRYVPIPFSERTDFDIEIID